MDERFTDCESFSGFTRGCRDKPTERRTFGAMKVCAAMESVRFELVRGEMNGDVHLLCIELDLDEVEQLGMWLAYVVGQRVGHQ
jgi:hypothetical protein